METKPTRLETAIDLKRDFEEYTKTRDRTALVSALRDQFLAQRHMSAAKTELVRQAAAETLLSKIPNMSDNMLLRTLEMLAKVGEIDLQAILGTVPGAKGPLFAFNQVIGGPSGQAPALTSNIHDPGETPVKSAGNILEAIELISNYMKNPPSNSPPSKVIDGEFVDDE